jgi:hypothetical protein
MIVGIAIKAAKSKTARKAARKAVKYVRKNVTVEIENGGLNVNIADRTLRIERDTFNSKNEVPAIAKEYDPFL